MYRRPLSLRSLQLLPVIGAVFLSATLINGLNGGAARAQNDATPVSVALFRGEVGGDSNIRLSSWGSGKAEASRDVTLIGDNSIKVTTQGLYQGARLEFKSPVDLEAAFRNPQTYLRLQVRFSGAGGAQNSFDPFSSETTRRAASPFQRMRFLLTMASGKQYELIRPIDIKPSEDPDSWVPIAFPLAAVTKTAKGEPFSGENARLAALAVFGDKNEQFYIGEVNVITDDTPILIAPMDAPIAFANNLIPFIADAESGASSLRYSWDFDASDGIQTDREGRSTQWYWRKEGKYTVTLTVSDVDNIKEPSKTTMEVEVTR